MGLLAGAPTIAGTLIGGLTYAEPLAVLFLAIGAGAILQVVCEVVRYQRRDTSTLKALASPPNAAGLLSGFLLMYMTAVLIAA